MKRLLKYPLVYVASPYRKYPNGLTAAAIAVGLISGRLMLAGVRNYSPIVYCHHISTLTGLNPTDNDFWIAIHSGMMVKADALLVAMMESWEISEGVNQEIDIFQIGGRPIYYLEPNSMRVFDNPQELADAEGC